jgi:hypothetical protein
MIDKSLRSFFLEKSLIDKINRIFTHLLQSRFSLPSPLLVCLTWVSNQLRYISHSSSSVAPVYWSSQGLFITFNDFVNAVTISASQVVGIIVFL